MKQILLAISTLIFYFGAYGQSTSPTKPAKVCIDTGALIKKGGTYVVQGKGADTTIGFLVPKNQRYTITFEQYKPPTSNGFVNFMKGFSLRQSIQSVKDNDEAAFVSLVIPKDSASSENLGFALAYNVLNSNTGITALKPYIEWQRNTLISKSQNAFFAGVAFQTSFWEIGEPNRPRWSPNLIVKANYKNDAEKHTEGMQASIYFTPICTRPFLPNYPTGSKEFLFYYNLYIGGEYENRARVTKDVEKGVAWRWYGRVAAWIYPLAKTLDQRLEIIPDFSYRNAFSNTSSAEERINKYFKLSTNVVLVKTAQSKFAEIKLGYDYITGCDPTAGFDNQTIHTISLKIKI